MVSTRDLVETATRSAEEQPQLSLGSAAARDLTTTTKTVPQVRGISSRWLLATLPWVEVSGGRYRVNQRLAYAPGGADRVRFVRTADEVRVVPPSLREIPSLSGFGDETALAALADRFVRHEVESGTTIVEQGRPADQLYLVVHGKLNQAAAGAFDAQSALGVLADGGHFGDETLAEARGLWSYTVVAATACTLLSLSRQRFEAVLDESEPLRAQLRQFREVAQRPQNRRGEADIAIASGHRGEPGLPCAFADYEPAPEEYELSVAQTVLRVHSRVADLYNDPMDQVDQQLRLTIEALRERQEHELVNNRQFGLLHNVDRSQRIQTRSGPPTPDDMDELLTRRRGTRMFLAHPRAIAAFGRGCTRRGISPESVEVQGSRLSAWRGVPILPCDKLAITRAGTSSILALRTGEERHGVIGLHQTGLPDEHEPGLNIRFMGIDEKAIVAYLVSVYYSVAVLVPDALGALENVEISHPLG